MEEAMSERIRCLEIPTELTIISILAAAELISLFKRPTSKFGDMWYST